MGVKALDKDTLYYLAELFDKKADYYRELAFKHPENINMLHNMQSCTMLEARMMAICLVEEQEATNE